ncbi:MAG: GNAT family N-acetyltransferase [Thermoplasmata archaeon]|nr:GNAT family N-acetyltransferase [Thermoplasmata archaeon]
MPPLAFRPPVILEGKWVRLIPLSVDHAAELARAGEDPEIWAYMRTRPPAGEPGMRSMIEAVLADQSRGETLAFTQQLVSDGRMFGNTRFLDISLKDEAVEIGGTWIEPNLRRTPVNTESKRLLLGYAFDREGVHRVQIKTDLRNERSQRAIERLGAQREGVLREHLKMPDGTLRSSVYYSILRSEWPTVRDRLDRLLARPWPGPVAPRP